MNAPRFSLFGPSTADRLLAEAYALEIKLLRYPDDDGDMQTSIDVELKGTLAADDEGASVLLDLLAKFQQPRQGDCEGAV